jgi:Clostridium epsilon toxin ETX/Bacillus mosquitocidal toxin MTX2
MAIDPIDVVGQRVKYWSEINNPTDGPGTFEPGRSSLRVEYVDIAYGQALPLSIDPTQVDSAQWENNSSVQNSQVFTVDKTTTDSFTWTMKEGLKTGAKFGAKLPFVGQAQTTVELNLEATQSGTQSTARRWSYSATVPVAPHKRVVTSFIVNEAKYSIPFTATARVRGRVYIRFAKGGRYFQREISEMIEKSGWNPGTFEVQTSGTLTGTQGQTFVVRVDENDLAAARSFSVSPDQSFVLDSGMLRDGRTVSTHAEDAVQAEEALQGVS